MNKKWRKYLKINTGVMMASLLLTGCLKTPDFEYVTNKEAQGSYAYEETISSENLATQLGVPEHVSDSFESPDGLVQIKIDANVTVSSGNKVPVYSVIPLEYSEEQLRLYTEQIYDGDFYRLPYEPYQVGCTQTKEAIEMLIDDWQTVLDKKTIADENATISEDGFVVDEEGNVITGMITLEEYQKIQNRITELVSELNAAPSEKELCQEPSFELELYTGQLKDFAPDGSLDMVTTDYNYEAAEFLGDRNGKRFFLTYEQDDRNSILNFWLDYHTELECGDSRENISLIDGVRASANDAVDNQCSVTLEEAEEMCRNCLQELGLEDFDVRAVRHLTMRTVDDQIGHYRGYRVYCYRSYGDMGDIFYHGYRERRGDEDIPNTLSSLMTYDAAAGIIQPAEGMNREMAVFTVMDEGIVEAAIINPRKNKECLAENTKLMDFDTVLQQGMAQLSVEYATAGENQRRNRILINAIELNYACMENPNSPNEYTMIPVWDFKIGWAGDTLITINAVDGTVFNRLTGH